MTHGSNSIRHAMAACVAAVAWLVAMGVEAGVGVGVGATAQAQTQPGHTSVTAELDRSRVAVGDATLLVITVEGTDADSTPVAPAVPGLDIQFFDAPRSSFTSTSIINGRRTTQTRVTVQYRYRVEPLRPGRFDIPSIPVTVGGRTAGTPELTLLASEPAANPDFFVELEVEPKEAYVGEPVLLRATWYVSRSVDASISFTLPGLERLRVSAAPDPRPRGTPNNDPQYPRIAFLGELVPAVLAEVERNGQRFTAVTLERVITATQAGEYALGPLRVAFNASDDRRRSDIRLFPGHSQRIVIASKPVTLTVRPLPAAGRPSGFDAGGGLVGEYSVRAAGTPLAVRAGDPIELTLRVSGSVTASLVPPMVLTSQRELAERFRVPIEPIVPRVDERDAVFSATIRPRPGTTRIPPMSLSVFDTKLGQYRVLKTDPIALNVLPGGLVSGDEPVATAINEPEAPREAEPVRLSSAAVDIDALSRGRGVVAAALVPPAAAALLIAGVLARRRWVRDPAAQSRRAARRAIRALRRIETARPDAPDVAAARLREFESRVAALVPPGSESLAEVARRIDRLDRRRFAGRQVVLDRKDIVELEAAVRAAVAAPEASAGAKVARRVGVWMLVAATLALPIAARAADPAAALENLRAAEDIAATDSTQAKALAATALDQLAPLASGPAGGSASLHAALARAYGVTGDLGRRALALRRAERLAPWKSPPETLSEGAEASGAAAGAVTAPTPLAWAAYVRVIDAPARLWLLAAAWAAMWAMVVVRVAVGAWGGWANRLLVGAACVAVLAAAAVGLDVAQTVAQRDEVVIVKAVTARAGPDDVVFDAVGTPIAPGTLVHLADGGGSEPGWMKVRLGPQSEPVWIASGAGERVVR